MIPSTQADMLSPMIAMMFLAQVFFVFRWAPLVDCMACAMLFQASESPEGAHVGGPYREALFAALASTDDRVMLASMSVFLALLDRPEQATNVPLLQLAGLLPMRFATAEKTDYTTTFAALMQTVQDGVLGVGEGTEASAMPTRTLSMGLLPAVNTAQSEPQAEAEGQAAGEAVAGTEAGAGAEVVMQPEGATEAEGEAEAYALPEPEAARQAQPEPDLQSSLVAPGGTSVEDLIRALLTILSRHTEGIRIIVLEIAMKLILNLKNHESADPLLAEIDLQSLQVRNKQCAAPWSRS